MDRKTILAYIVIILIFLALPYYYKLITPQKQPSVVEQTQEGPSGDPSAAVLGAVDSTSQRESGLEEEAAPPEYADATVLISSSGFIRSEREDTVTVETPLMRMQFSTRGGVLIGCVLKKYAGQADGRVELVQRGSRENLNLILFRGGDPVDLQSAAFQADKPALMLAEADADSVVLTASTGDGALVRKILKFSGSRYRFDLEVGTEGMKGLDPYYELHWGSGMAVTEVDTAQDLYYSKAFAYMGGELEKFDGKGDKELRGGAEGETRWVAQRRKYFEVVMLPTLKPANGVAFGIDPEPLRGKHRVKTFRMALRMKGSLEQQRDAFTIYCGPIDQKQLANVDPKLEETMNWGWAVIEPFSKLILWSLKGLHEFIPNYGLVLIVFSVLIKIVIWPLTHKSTRSMARMAAIQPKLKELQEKYKANPEKLNKAMMQLYKEEGVNPFSGCWPTLLQMPLLYALFIIFRSTIELRGAPFLFWIKDLSMPDVVAKLPFSIPMYGSEIAVLPIVMGFTQFLMSKVMITDPKQKFTMYFMPIFMVLIFNNFPSGLTLYYALFNLWTYLQQMMLKKQGLLPASVGGATKV